MTERILISVITKNRPGAFSRISGLFTQRGYNMESIIAGKSEKEGYSRITIEVIESIEVVDQIVKQLYKVIDVEKVRIIENTAVVREHMLIKIKSDRTNRSDIIEIANIYRAKILNVTQDNLIIELTGDIEKIEGFITVMQDYGIVEIARTGTSAMTRTL
ncbi:MAG: acetolactate synthase small subunit [Fusobacteriaceae bacterium]|jgi:acetolactate synthase-1/3 small subunit|nr:acetolactate synthase small subunit [Fusobacteriaceae bacterium]